MKLRMLTVLAVITLVVMAFANTTQGGGTGAGAGWTGPTNIGGTEAVYATQSIAAGGTSTSLSTSTFNFAVPAGATINGIQVDIVRHCSAITSCAFSALGGNGINLTKVAATATGTNKSDATTWGVSDGTTTFGSAADLWGTTWTQSDVNASGFGAITTVDNNNGTTARTASIDSIIITVTFTPAAASSSGFLKLFGLYRSPTPISQTRGGHSTS